MKYIEFRVQVKDGYDIAEVAEAIKDTIYDFENYDPEMCPIKDVTYEIRNRVLWLIENGPSDEQAKGKS